MPLPAAALDDAIGEVEKPCAAVLELADEADVAGLHWRASSRPTKRLQRNPFVSPDLIRVPALLLPVVEGALPRPLALSEISGIVSRLLVVVSAMPVQLVAYMGIQLNCRV